MPLLTAPTLPDSNSTTSFGPQLPTYTNPANQSAYNLTPYGTSATYNTSGAITNPGTGIIGQLQKMATNSAYSVPEKDQLTRSAELTLALQNLSAAGRQNQQNLLNQVLSGYDAQIPGLLDRNANLGQQGVNAYTTGMNSLADQWTNAAGTGMANTAQAAQTGNYSNLLTDTSNPNSLANQQTGLNSAFNNRATDLTGQYTGTNGLNNAWNTLATGVAGTAGTASNPAGTGYTGLQNLQDINTNTLGTGLTGGLSDYLTAINGLNGLVDTYGSTAKTDLGLQRDSQLAGNQASLASRGLGNTTVLDSMNRGTNFDYGRNLQSLNESINNQKLAAGQQLAQSKLGAIQSNAQLQNQLAQQGIQQRQQTIDQYNQAQQQALAARERGIGVNQQTTLDALNAQNQGVDRNLNAGMQSIADQAQLRQGYDQNYLSAFGQAPQQLASLMTQQQQQDTALGRDLSNQRLQFMANQLGQANQYPTQTEVYNTLLQALSSVPYPVSGGSSNSYGALLA